MRTRGQIYWNWADPELHCRNHDERLPSGILLNIQVRLSKTNQTQLFVGIYGQTGMMIFEDGFLDRPGQTMSQALVWGLDFARERVSQSVPNLASPPKERRQRSF
ncbi:hypothetical protein [Pseudomonas fluorescens]